jgi:hypothetical protein
MMANFQLAWSAKLYDRWFQLAVANALAATLLFEKRNEYIIQLAAS